MADSYDVSVDEVLRTFGAAAKDMMSFRSEVNSRIDGIEATLDRPRGGGNIETALTAEQREYNTAINAYFRRGDSGIGADVKNTLSVGSDPDGGYWVTPDMRGRIAKLMYESSPMRQIAAVQAIGTDSLQGFNDLDEASAAWVEETGTRSETTAPGAGKWEIHARELYAQPKVTQKLLEDGSIDVADWLTQKIAEKFSRLENTAFVSGDGVGKPRGFLTYTAGTPSSSTWDVIEQTNTGASGDFASSAPADVLFTALYGLKAGYLNANTRWVMNRSTLAAVSKLKDGQGNYLLTAGGVAGSVPLSLLGYPVILADDMPVMAVDSLSIGVGDFKQAYQIVDRLGVSLLRDPYTEKGYVKFYARKRTGGDVVNFEALKLIKFAA